MRMGICNLSGVPSRKGIFRPTSSLTNWLPCQPKGKVKIQPGWPSGAGAGLGLAVDQVHDGVEGRLGFRPGGDEFQGFALFGGHG